MKTDAECKVTDQKLLMQRPHIKKTYAKHTQNECNISQNERNSAQMYATV